MTARRLRVVICENSGIVNLSRYLRPELACPDGPAVKTRRPWKLPDA